jgi:hypothetical protein
MAAVSGDSNRIPRDPIRRQRANCGHTKVDEFNSRFLLLRYTSPLKPSSLMSHHHGISAATIVRLAVLNPGAP